MKPLKLADYEKTADTLSIQSVMRWNMKRDWELIKKILVMVEASDVSANGVKSTSITGYDHGLVCAHISLLQENSYIEGHDYSSSSLDYYQVTGLTWKGYDLLDTLRDQSLT